MASRYGLPRDVWDRWRASRVGRWLHPLYKAVGGAYSVSFRPAHCAVATSAGSTILAGSKRSTSSFDGRIRSRAEGASREAVRVT